MTLLLGLSKQGIVADIVTKVLDDELEMTRYLPIMTASMRARCAVVWFDWRPPTGCDRNGTSFR